MDKLKELVIKSRKEDLSEEAVTNNIKKYFEIVGIFEGMEELVKRGVFTIAEEKNNSLIHIFLCEDTVTASIYRKLPSGNYDEKCKVRMLKNNSGNIEVVIHPEKGVTVSTAWMALNAFEDKNIIAEMVYRNLERELLRAGC